MPRKKNKIKTYMIAQKFLNYLKITSHRVIINNAGRTFQIITAISL